MDRNGGLWRGAVMFIAVGALGGGAARGEESSIVVEAFSGRILLANEAAKRRPVASLTKVATAKMALDWAKVTGVDLGTMAVVPASAALTGGANPMGLRPGDRISLRNALYSALMGSDNIAAETLADHVGRAILRNRGIGADPVEAFVKEMNVLAKALGMTRTKFENPHGMDHGGKRGSSTAMDMARLCIYAMRDSGFAFFVKQKGRPISFERGGQTVEFTVRNTNELLGELEVSGIKTGLTNQAGQCLATSSERAPHVVKLSDGKSRVTSRRLICVVLGSPDRFGRTRALIPQGWALYDDWMAKGAMVTDAGRELLQVPNPR